MLITNKILTIKALTSELERCCWHVRDRSEKPRARHERGLVAKSPTHGGTQKSNTLLPKIEQNPSDSIQVYMDAYAQDPDLFTNNLRNSIEQMTANNSVEDFKSQVLSSLMSDRDFDVQDGSNAQTAKHYMLCTALYNYILLQPDMFAQLVNTSIQPQNDMYMDSLMAVSDSNTLLQMAYTLSPDNTIDALYANAGRDAMLNAICTIPDLTQQKLHWLFGSKYDFDPAPWSTASTTTTTLIKQQTYLAEHHLYGSSRLGIKKYLPNHYCYNWALGSTSNISADSSSLNQIQIWYNPEINDFIKSYIPAYTSATQLDKQPWTSYNVIGLKNYELTNHLGNVQATILDRYTRRTNGAEDTSYHVYNTDIKTATDYYPFGSPMPGRYTQDTASQSFVVMAPLVVQGWDVATTLQSILGSFVPDNTGVYMQNTSPPISHVVVNKGSYTSGVNFNWGTFLTLPNMIVGKHYQLYINNAKSIGNFYRINGAMIINTATTATNGMNMIDFICTATTENFVIEAQMFTTATYFVIDSALLLVENNVNTTVATTVTSAGDGDFYRFSVNGQMRCDEFAGVGNHTTAEFWEYDTRLGRRQNRDCKPKVNESEYACFGNNPIENVDIKGDDSTSATLGGGRDNTATKSNPNPNCSVNKFAPKNDPNDVTVSAGQDHKAIKYSVNSKGEAEVEAKHIKASFSVNEEVGFEDHTGSTIESSNQISPNEFFINLVSPATSTTIVNTRKFIDYNKSLNCNTPQLYFEEISTYTGSIKAISGILEIRTCYDVNGTILSDFSRFTPSANAKIIKNEHSQGPTLGVGWSTGWYPTDNFFKSYTGNNIKNHK